MSQGKLNVFMCLLPCKIESCDKVNWMYLFVLQCNRQINTFSLPCDMILSYNVIDK
jgi:hypothetical protein